MKAVVLLSGGLDSAVAAALAKSRGFDVHALSIDYGHRQRIELLAAAKVAKHLGIQHEVAKVDLWLLEGSAYVPARNLVFLSLAAAYAESIGALDIFIGVNAADHADFPDCRSGFISALQLAIDAGTKAEIVIRTPLISMRKSDIICLGVELGVDFAMTSTCYEPSDVGRQCGRCAACFVRRRGFNEAGVKDPLT